MPALDSAVAITGAFTDRPDVPATIAVADSVPVAVRLAAVTLPAVVTEAAVAAPLVDSLLQRSTADTANSVPLTVSALVATVMLRLVRCVDTTHWLSARGAQQQLRRAVVGRG